MTYLVKFLFSLIQSRLAFTGLAEDGLECLIHPPPSVPELQSQAGTMLCFLLKLNLNNFPTLWGPYAEVSKLLLADQIEHLPSVLIQSE